MQGGKMKLDEDLRPDREDDFQTDDEENQAHRVFENLDDDSDSDNSPLSPSLSNEISTISWPQSYRQSMDMLTSATPPGLNLLKRIGSVGRSNSSIKRSKEDSSLTLPFVSETNLIKQDEHHASTPCLQPLVSSSARFSVNELPPPQQQCSFTKSVINGTNILCGIGILTIPYAMKEGGSLSLIILFMFAIMCCYTGLLLIRCLESNIGLKTYPDIGQAAFGIVGRLGIAIFLYVELFVSARVRYAFATIFHIYTLALLILIPTYRTDFNTEQIFAVTAAVLILPTVWLRNLSLLSYISVGGIFATIVVALCLFWVGTVDKVAGFKPGEKVLDLAHLPVSIGLYSFCFAGHAVFPNIYSSMKEPSKFPSVLYVCFAFCLVMYVSVGIMGYITFGDLVSSQFTLNMPKELCASEIATWTTVVTPLTKYALTLLPIALSIEELATSPRLRCHAVSVFVRTTLVILSLFVALSIPYFGSLMALIGSFMSIVVALIYPCACFLKLHTGRLSNAEITNCVLIIVVGLICACIGTHSAVQKIIGEGD